MVKKRQTIYIAGPMTGHEAYNHRAFAAAQEFLQSMGWNAVTPFASNSVVWQRHYGRDFDPYTDACDYGEPILNEMIAEDIGALCRAYAIALLPGWENSRGARIELVISLNLGKPVYDAMTNQQLPNLSAGFHFVPVESKGPMSSRSILQEAEDLVRGSRGADYGHPIDDYTRTGRMWGAILGIPDIDPRICAIMMEAMKMSRETHKPKRDNRVDMAGYALCADLIAQKQAEG